MGDHRDSEMTMLLVLLLVTLDVAFCQEAVPVLPSAPHGEQSPCDWVLELRRAGAPLPDQIALATAQASLFTPDDLRCLRREGVHPSLIDSVKARRAEAEDAAEAELRREREAEEAGRRRIAQEEKAARAAEAAERRRIEEELARQRAAAELAARVDIELVAVLVGPAKADRRAWDGFGTVDRGTVGAVLALASGTPTVAPAIDLATATVNLMGATTQPPDIYGYAQFLGPDAPADWSGLRLSLLPPLGAAADTVYANFPGSPSFRSVRPGPGDSVRITLYDDDDFTEDDLIGVFDIGPGELAAAKAVDGLAMVNVAAQTGGQVVLLVLKVRQASNLETGMQGTVFAPSP